MKNLVLFLIIFAMNIALGQEKQAIFMNNKGVITFIDNNMNANFAISFNGDKVISLSKEKSIFKIDSNLIQITKYPIDDTLMSLKYDSLGETKLFEHFRDYEFNYTQNEIYKQEIKYNNIFFQNNYSKRFLLWYFQVPDNIVKSMEKQNGVKESYVKKLGVEYQIFLSFTTNSFVTMVNIPVLSNENLVDKIEAIKSKISNSVRVYEAGISIQKSGLYNQIENKVRNQLFIIDDKENGIEFKIPFWLNIGMTDKCFLFGTFPDIDNVSNALSLGYLKKSYFDSFKSFENRFLIGEEKKSYEKLQSSTNNNNMTRYKVIEETKEGYKYICQFVFLNLVNEYALIIFTATPNTYDKNVKRFDEFIESIKIK